MLLGGMGTFCTKLCGMGTFCTKLGGMGTFCTKLGGMGTFCTKPELYVLPTQQLLNMHFEI